MCCIWPFFSKCCVTCVLFAQLFIFCFKRKLFLLHKALKCNKENKKGDVSYASFTVSAEIQCENIQKEPCEPFCFVQKSSWQCIPELQMWDQVLVQVDMKTFSTRGSRKFICGGHRVRKFSSLVQLAQKCRNDTDAALYFSLWGCHLIQTEKRHPADFSSCSAVAWRQSNMNFSGFEKSEKHPAKDLCLTPTHNCVPTYNNSNNKTPLCFHIQSDSSLSLFLIQSSYCRSDIGWLPLLPLSVCLSVHCHRCKYWLLPEERRKTHLAFCQKFLCSIKVKKN